MPWIVGRPYTAGVSTRTFEPTHLDVQAFAAEGAALDGFWPLVQFNRIFDSVPADATLQDGAAVAWRVRGERRVAFGEAQTWLHVEADATVAQQCQRCLAPVPVALEVRRSFRFVPGEDAAAQLDSESNDDVLAMTRALDLRELVEDELLLALPLVPMHGVCPEPLAAPPDDAAAEERPNPFALLAALKGEGRLS